MKKIVLFTLIIIAIYTSLISGAQVKFNDIDNHWAKENILRQASNGIINGYEDGTFRPNNEVTVLEFIKIILNTLNIELDESGLNEWPDYYIDTAKKNGLPDNYYELLTRNEAIEIISKLIDLSNVKMASNKFKDLDSKYKSNILKLVNLKIISGYEDRTFRGSNNITRAEAVTIAIRSLDARANIIQNKKYTISPEYTNYGVDVKDKGTIDKIRYEIKNNKLVFFDEGRFSKIENYEINEKYITNNKLIKIINKLISEDSYTAVYYVPSKYIINQIIIKYAENDKAVSKDTDYFNVTYYEDKLYDLGRITLNDTFSNECYMKINIKKLWKENYEFENNNYINEDIKNKLLDILKIEFEDEADEVLDYMINKYLAFMNGKLTEGKVTEQIKLKKHTINFYKTDAMSLEFYFE